MRETDNTTPHLATTYDNQVVRTIPYHNCFHDETINIVKAIMPDPKSWLDTGCGTGTLVSRCMKIFPDTMFLLADPSREMLNEAKIKLLTYPDNRIKFLEPVATQNISLEKNLHLDIVTAIQAHHYLSGEERKISTEVCYQILKRGGLFITFENIRPLTDTGIEAGKQNWSNYQLSKGKNRDQVEEHIKRFDIEYFPITIKEHLDLYQGCGFKVEPYKGKGVRYSDEKVKRKEGKTVQ